MPAGLARLGGDRVAEAPLVHPARHDHDAARVAAHALELGHLVRARGDHPVDAAGERALDLDAGGRARVARALVAALDHPERVEGVDDRDPQ